MRDQSGERLATVWVAERARDAMIAEAERRFPRETGGVLLGYWSPEGADVVITRIIGPGPRATHLRWGFLPDHEFQEREIASVYRESGRRVTYLGDWHTHPRGPLRQSWTDRRTHVRIARHRAARAPRALMAILAGGNPWSLGVWSVRADARLIWAKDGAEQLHVTYFSAEP